MKVPDNDLEMSILELATEDEYLLVQIRWALESILPGSSEESVIRAGQQALSNLIRNEDVRLYVVSPESPLDQLAAIQTALDPLSWVRPESWNVAIKVLATDRGRNRYFGSSRTGNGD
jgi:hypothetical protein